VLYGYDDNAVWVVNNLHTPVSGAMVHVSVINLDATEKFVKDASLDIAADSSTQAIAIPKIDGLSPTYFVRMELRDSANQLLSGNFYWLSTTPETLDWTKTNYFVTPVVQHADLKALNDLPKVKLEATAHSTRSAREWSTRVSISNPSKTIAFAVELKLKDAKGEMIAPVLWQDNYFSLLPGEKRTITVRYAAQPSNEHATVHVSGWNVESGAVKLTPGASAGKAGEKLETK
ncbi:MAG TPA: glycoside hydrolase family 2 protein, partial [Terriglobales bacterium]|nr:glycoside hydrolase family 2 protein [Terriglobales bacterium]